MIPVQILLAGVRELPALPAAVMELIQSLGDERFGSEQLATTISHDQALAAKTLKLANSPFYGLSREVSTIADATTILGLRTLRSVAMAAGLTSGSRSTDCAGFDVKPFWRHSIGTAMCAGSLARTLRIDEGVAFTLGLLHDVGRLVLASSFPALYAEVLARQQGLDGTALDAERDALGMDHAQLGALVAEHWKFAPRIARAIATHHEPQGEKTGTSLADLVHVADNMAHALDLSRSPDDLVPPLSMAAWSRLALDEGCCLEVFTQTEAQHDAVCQALLS